MRRWVKIGSAAAGGLAAGALAVAAGTAAWRRATARAVAGLTSRAQAQEPAPNAPADEPFSHTKLTGLPAPVARYFAFALPEGQPLIRYVHIRWAGEFQTRPGGGWSPFTAEQDFTTTPPGFVWDADIRMIPLIPMRVRDSYIAGTGSMLGRMGGVVPVVDQGGSREMASGALMRWLGEAAWFPTALLPRSRPDEGVRWDEVDDSTARATLADGETTVQADFHFAPTGEIRRMTATRYRDVKGVGVLTPFEGVNGPFERRDGIMIPSSAEVAWLLPEGRFPYWRGRPVEVRYETARK
jgi:hypothetical protein